ncbi:MAG: c-type cytochrome [Massilia sp.]
MFHSSTRWPLRHLAKTVLAAAATLGGPEATSAQSTGNVDSGKSLYDAKCGGCHAIDANRVGPLHRGVVGRKVASVPNYEYSPALKRLGGTWTRERLDRFLQGPQDLAPGSKMYFSLDDSEQRRDIIAFLASVSGAGSDAKSPTAGGAYGARSSRISRAAKGE